MIIEVEGQKPKDTRVSLSLRNNANGSVSVMARKDGGNALSIISVRPNGKVYVIGASIEKLGLAAVKGHPRR